MHLMLGPDILCRLLIDDPALNEQAKKYIDRAQMLSVPAATFTVLMKWRELGKLEGDPLDILSLLEEQAVPIVPLTGEAYRTLVSLGWSELDSSKTSLEERLMLAQAVTANALFLTENQPLSQLAPGNALWMPPPYDT